MTRLTSALLVAAVAAAPLWAQTRQTDTAERVLQGGGAIVRGLDRRNGTVRDLQFATGETKAFGRIQITLGECRYPADNPSGNAYAYLVVRDAGEAQPLFTGWMIASAPALSALEHPRYDVWVMRCST